MGDKLTAQKDIMLESPQSNIVYNPSNPKQLIIAQYWLLSYRLNKWQHNWAFTNYFPIFYYPL